MSDQLKALFKSQSLPPYTQILRPQGTTRGLLVFRYLPQLHSHVNSLLTGLCDHTMWITPNLIQANIFN